MIKGHVQVDLHNHKTGLRDRIEGDNMITNAMNYVIPNVIGSGKTADCVMPLCEKVLGGIMLFDGKLTENKIIYFSIRGTSCCICRKKY